MRIIGAGLYYGRVAAIDMSGLAGIAVAIDHKGEAADGGFYLAAAALVGPPWPNGARLDVNVLAGFGVDQRGLKHRIDVADRERRNRHTAIIGGYRDKLNDAGAAHMS